MCEFILFRKFLCRFGHKLQTQTTMDNFNEFDSVGKVPNRDSGSIISHAFELYKGIFIYPIVAGIIFFIAVSIMASITGLGAMFIISAVKTSLMPTATNKGVEADVSRHMPALDTKHRK